jgi:hypothetical protein
MLQGVNACPYDGPGRLLRLEHACLPERISKTLEIEIKLLNLRIIYAGVFVCREGVPDSIIEFLQSVDLLFDLLTVE